MDNGKQANGNGKVSPIDALAPTGNQAKSIATVDRPLASDVGTIHATQAGAALQAVNEVHEYTVEDRKAMSAKVAVKLMLEVSRNELVRAGILEARTGKK